MSSRAVEDGLRAECQSLADEDLLALCYGLGQSSPRLRLYLDILRGRGGERAQLAACLICFDLASRGDRVAEGEFALLAGAVEDVAAHEGWVAAEVASAPYLAEVWRRCAAALAQLDPLAPAPAADLGAAPAAHVPLLSDADFGEVRIEVDARTLWRRFEAAVDAFLGGIVGVPIYDQSAGFRLAGRRDTERLEAFLSQLASLGPQVPPARGFRALAHLFLGSHLRPRGLFGAVNARKQQLLRAGLAEFFAEPQAVWQVVGVFATHHADPGAWPRLTREIYLFLGWLAADRERAGLAMGAYDPVGEAAARGR